MRISTEGISGMRKFWVPNTSDLIPFMQEVIGQWVLMGQNQQCYFQAPLPFPGYSNVVPEDIQVSPHMGSSPKGTFPVDLDTTYNDYESGWDVTVQYKTVYNLQQQISGMPSVANGTYLSFEQDFGAEYLTIPGRSFYWTYPSGGVNVYSDKPVGEDASPGVLVATRNFTLTWDRVLLPPWDAIAAATGKINSLEFMDAPAGCTLFLGAQVTRQFQFTDDSGFWKIQYKFSEQNKTLNSGTRVGWNYFWKPKAWFGENWYTIIDKDNNAYPYDSTDFSGLFVMPIQC